MMYQHGTYKVEVASEVVGENDEEVADEQAEQNHEDLHEGDVEVADHVEFREVVLGSDSHSADRAAGSAERVSIHDGAQVGILTETAA